MRRGLYFQLAKDGIRKNARLYVPYILTCIGMVMMYYILVFLQTDPFIACFKGGKNAQTLLGLGSWVIAFFSCIFLFYTNSFLIRRRKREFGLYHILGMGRRHIAVVLFWENVIAAFLALAAGLSVGILFSKLAELVMVRILNAEAALTFTVSPMAVRSTVILFCVIFFLLFLNGVRQVRSSSALALLGSEKTGEKPPKGNALLALLAAAMLGAAYWTSATIDNPLQAMNLFFIAVLMVIAATYLLMIAGSVFFCKLLMKHKKYYYDKRHFVSVSSMVYRMRRNGAGLASICILATMVLVMAASTSCLYFGCEDILYSHYPREICVAARSSTPDVLRDENLKTIREESERIAAELGTQISGYYYCRTGQIYGALDGDTLRVHVPENEALAFMQSGTVRAVCLIPLADYNETVGKDISLESDEVLLYATDGKFAYDNFTIEGAGSFRVKEKLKDCPFDSGSLEGIMDTIYVFVPDMEQVLAEAGEKLRDGKGNSMMTYMLLYGFDTGLSSERQTAFFGQFRERFHAIEEGLVFESCYCEAREAERDSLYATLGGLFFLGILLSIVFIAAAVLIIYYKQISEGYEDQMRFEIMQKIGMTHGEIRQSINSQMLTVFFFPLLFAGVHFCFAFPMIRKILMLFSLFNVKLFLMTSLISYLVFALFYMLVYKGTSDAYFEIVKR